MLASDKPAHGVAAWQHWSLSVLFALAFKQFYATAGAEHLQWLLWPLAQLLNVVSGLAFQPLPSGEWLDAKHSLVIVKACAGGNFLIASWLGYLWRWRAQPFGSTVLLRACGAAWATTLAANALRIILITYVQDDLTRLTGLSETDSHRLIGIGIYFSILCLQLWIGRSDARAITMATLFYLGIALVLPVLRAWSNGLSLDDGYIVWTAGVPLAMLSVYGVFFAITNARKRGGELRSQPLSPPIL